MVLSFCLIVVLRDPLLKLLLFQIVVASTSFASIANISFPSIQPSCHEDEKLALLQFKESFIILRNASAYEGAYPKVLQWKSGQRENTSNCCSWDGVECDEQTGNVIGLDLSSSCLFGFINSSSTLFGLRHLRRLSLADNHFNYSEIPPAIAHLPRLTNLNLSSSLFSGQVPIEISKLSMLTYLDLSLNSDPNNRKFLQLKNPSVKTLLLNLTRIEILNLSQVHISSQVPEILANFTSLSELVLDECELYGDFPAKIFHLPNLRTLSVRNNPNLSGHLPEFHERSPLTTLRLSSSSFSGKLPSSINKLDSLDRLEISTCSFSGSIPSSLGELTKLTYLDLAENNFIDDIPSTFQNLTNLASLFLDHNKITGSIPLWLGNFTQLNELDLQYNLLHDAVPQSLSKLMNLETLYLNGNKLSGTLNFDMFFNMTSLADLGLGGNNLSIVFPKTNTNATSPKFKFLGLDSCHLTEFPNFLRHQDELKGLDLGGNKIYGHIPKWMWNTSVDTLYFFDVSNNFLKGFNQQPVVLPWVNLQTCDFSSNMIQGPLPIPPPSTFLYDVSNNMLTGEVSNFFCNMSSLKTFDLSDNRLRGTIPDCLSNHASSSLSVLSLRNNSFHGVIPQICGNSGASRLRLIDLSYNKLQGQLPQSLSKCMMLAELVISNNQIDDSFPSWLGSLPELKLLILRHNRFHGQIKRPETGMDQFAMLQVIDLSSNDFSGVLPSDYIFGWNAMKSAIESSGLKYMSANWDASLSSGYQFSRSDTCKITITFKGVDIYYGAINDNFAFVDLSNNSFEGEISELFGDLKAIHSLNLSNNMLTGFIPSSLRNLTALESLDLSRNKLSGEIPQELKQLGFLQSFNVSHNNLVGRIPQGNLFNTFDSSSFEGNPGLCGDQLPKKCESSSNPQPPVTALEEGDEDSTSLLGLVWKFLLAGYVSGLVVGVVLADIMIERRPEWLIEMLSRCRGK